MRHEIPAALTEASASARVIVLTGAGFCADQDLKTPRVAKTSSSSGPCKRIMNSMRSSNARSRPLRRSAAPSSLDNRLAQEFAVEAELQGEADRTGDFKEGVLQLS
jgi:hypothetical protein